MTKIGKRHRFGVLGVVAFAVAIALGAACGGLEDTPPAPVNPVDGGVADSAPPIDASVPDSAPPVDASVKDGSVPDAAHACSYVSFAAKVDYATGFTPAGVAVGDFNGDQKPDLVEANANSTTVSVLLNQCK